MGKRGEEVVEVVMVGADQELVGDHLDEAGFVPERCEELGVAEADALSFVESAGIERAAGERQVLRNPDLNARPGNPRPARLDERRARVDGGNVLGADDGRKLAGGSSRAAAHVEHALPGPDRGGAGQPGRELPTVAPQVAVICLGGGGHAAGRSDAPTGEIRAW